MIDDAHAVRIAKRLARHYNREDKLLRPGIINRLWSLLETHPAAREAYACPPDQVLKHHGPTLSLEELEGAVDGLRRETRFVVSTPDEAA